ncbi:MAG: zinc-binding dehydrogenase [Sciscionella sp.]
MRAVLQYAFGPAQTLCYEQVDDPSPGPGQVRIAVRAAGVHPLDIAIRNGGADLRVPVPDVPMIPGREVAGVVDAVGDGVDAGWLGRRVVTNLGLASGGYAELTVREVGAVHVLPDGLAEDVAVAMVGTGRTAMGILDTAQLVDEDVVLVTAAAGGVGNLLVQAVRDAGASVIGLAGGPAKVECVRRLLAPSWVGSSRHCRENGCAIGAVDYSAPDWTSAVREALNGREVTVAFDGVGGRLGRSVLGLLGAGGRLIMYGWFAEGPTELSASDLYARGLTASAVMGPRIPRQPGGLRNQEAQSLRAAATGRLVPLIQRFPLDDVVAAHIALESRATVGKVVLIP